MANRNSEFRELYDRAVEAGLEAGRAVRPRTMVVRTHRDPLNDASPVVQEWVVPEGACGFATVTVRPANSAFGRWLKANNLGYQAHYGGGGRVLSVHVFNQSVERKEAYARAFAEVLRAAGVKANWDSRLD